MFWKVIRCLCLALQAAVSLAVIVSLIRAQILQPWQITLIAFALIFILALTSVLAFHRKTPLAAKIAATVFSILIATAGAFVLRYTATFNAFLDRVTEPTSDIAASSASSSDASSAQKNLTEHPFILYISGSDSRTSVDDPTARSDVNILAVVNPIHHKILLVSIPRDTYVHLHGTTGLRDKLTHAAYYGIDMSRATIEDFLGITIDHTLKVSFDTVVQVVDQLGGVEIYSDRALYLHAESSTDPAKYCQYYAGTQTVDGDCALRFARERKSYTTGDMHRGENQQAVLSGIITKFMSSRSYLFKVPEILGVVADSFRTSLSRDQITEFLRWQLSTGAGWQIETANIEGVGDLLPTYSMGPDDPRWVLLADESSITAVSAAIKSYLAE